MERSAYKYEERPWFCFHCHGPIIRLKMFIVRMQQRDKTQVNKLFHVRCFAHFRKHRAPGTYEGIEFSRELLERLLAFPDSIWDQGGEYRDFWIAYGRLAEEGVCNSPGGSEYGRVVAEWEAAGRPKAIGDFIRSRANIGPGFEEEEEQEEEW